MAGQSYPANENHPAVAESLPAGKSKLETASLVFGILAILTVGLTGIVAILLGHLALVQAGKTGKRSGGRRMAVVGLSAGYFSLVLFVGLVFVINKMPVASKSMLAKADFKSFESALAMYRMNAGSYPTTAQGLGALVERPSAGPLPRRWAQVMMKIPLDPYGSPYVYRFPGGKDPETFELVSKGSDGILGTRDDLNGEDE